MIDSVLKYVSVITVAGAAISFVVGLLKYLDQRNREERTKRFELFPALMGRVSAETEGSVHKLPLTSRCRLRIATLQGLCLCIGANS